MIRNMRSYSFLDESDFPLDPRYMSSRPTDIDFHSEQSELVNQADDGSLSIAHDGGHSEVLRRED